MRTGAIEWLSLLAVKNAAVTTLTGRATEIDERGLPPNLCPFCYAPVRLYFTYYTKLKLTPI